ncbi:MAG: hypothetical protein U0Y68_03955 [Blastocatellia bacterium]
MEIKVKRGVTVAGQAVLENNDNPEVLRKLAQVSVQAGRRRRWNVSGQFLASGCRDNFRLTGLRPGKLEVEVWSEEKGLRLAPSGTRRRAAGKHD